MTSALQKYFRTNSAMFIRLARVKVNIWAENFSLRKRKELRSQTMKIFHNNFTSSDKGAV